MINDPSTKAQFHLWYTVDFRPDSSGWRAKYEDATTGTESSRRVVGWLIQEDAAPSGQELMRRRVVPGVFDSDQVIPAANGGHSFVGLYQERPSTW
jgi:hypothetical protein